MTMFLSAEEIKELTGYTYKAKQKQWLVESGYKFSVRRDGFPCVLRTHVERVLGGLITSKANQPQPDAAALEALING